MDDQVTLLNLLKGNVKHLFLFSGEEPREMSTGIIRVRDWITAVKEILGTMD
jgi:hypothetical protein